MIVVIVIRYVCEDEDDVVLCKPARSFPYLLARPSSAIYASITTPTVSVCTVITSLYNTLHHKQNDRLQRHVLHHPNNRSRNQWLSYQLALLNGQSLNKDGHSPVVRL